MGRRVGCPYPKWSAAWIELPDEWLGLHIDARDRAVVAAGERGVEAYTLQRFAAALALLEDWGELPGLDGQPDRWDFFKVPAPIIGWVIGEVLDDFQEAFEVPKDLSSPSQSGPSERPTKEGMNETMTSDKTMPSDATMTTD